MPENYKAIARAIIRRHTTITPIISIEININTQTLGEDLALQAMSYLLAVCEVFDNLSSSYDRTFTGYYMIKATPDAVLSRIAGYKEGNALLYAISQYIGNNKLTQGGGWVNEFSIAENRIYTARRQAGQLTKYNPHGVRELHDYEIPKGGNREIRFELPEEGANYVVFNRNDELKDGLDQIGTKETINVIFKIAEVWKSKGTGAYFEVGDISRAGGLDTLAHQTHEDGKAFDMRPMRNDGGYGKPFVWQEVPPYHRDWTKSFIAMMRQMYPGTIVYFNDPLIFDTPEFRSYVFEVGKGTKEAHDNHLHVILPGGQRITNKEK